MAACDLFHFAWIISAAPSLTTTLELLSGLTKANGVNTGALFNVKLNVLLLFNESLFALYA